MLYHYFGSKDELFLAVLERIYDDIRHAETELHLEALDPVAAMRRLVEFSFGYFIDQPALHPAAQQREPAPGAAPQALASRSARCTRRSSR